MRKKRDEDDEARRQAARTERERLEREADDRNKATIAAAKAARLAA